MKIKRSGGYHEIKEMEVATELKLSTQKDYLNADNSDVIPTDTQKNTVYALAKKHEVRIGLRNPGSRSRSLPNLDPRSGREFCFEIQSLYEEIALHFHRRAHKNSAFALLYDVMNGLFLCNRKKTLGNVTCCRLRLLVP